MPLQDRAAQFAPFAALTGFESCIREKSRLTSRRIELDEYEIERLNYKLRGVCEHIGEMRVAITYFVPDKVKSGGVYITKIGAVKSVSEYQRIIVMDDGTDIPIEEIINVEELEL
jgi:hypothetical protein